jgi:hypothetical protein
MNPLAPGPMPGIPIYEWHTQTFTCGTSFTEAEAEEAERRRRREDEEKALRIRRQQEAQRQVATLERERDAALQALPAVDRPDPVKKEIGARGCTIGCGLWAGLLGVALIVLGASGQLDGDSDPTIFGVENPLLFLPAAWLIGWILASIELARARLKHRVAEAAAERRAGRRAQVEEDFGKRIAAAERAARAPA